MWKNCLLPPTSKTFSIDMTLVPCEYKQNYQVKKKNHQREITLNAQFLKLNKV